MTLRALACLLCLIPTSAALAQSQIAAGGWEGFATRDTDNKFDRCVLYNKSIEALTVSPYNMLGITQSASGQVGLMVFFTPSALKRGNNIPVTLRIDNRKAVALNGVALSDFHINIAGPIGAETLGALRQATSVEAAAEGKSERFDVTDVGAVLDALDACVKANVR
jgi:hypothetical protein